MIMAIIGHDEFNGQVHFVRKREETAERPEKLLIGPFPPTLPIPF